ncbi:MAG: glycerophosphodiester phosphodiesterase family protein [Melioribacteraceae bacterium]
MQKIKVFLILISLIIIQSCSTTENGNKVKVVAHRGASAYAPENTLASMQKAIEMKAYMSELDVQETADGEIILLHDRTLKKTAGIDKNIWEMNYADLKGIDVGSWFSEDYANEPIPTLKEVIDLVKGKMKLNIELKANKHEKKLAERSLKIVEDNNFLDQVIFTSFKFDEIRRIRELNENVKVGYIFGKLPEDVDVFSEDVDLLSVHYKTVDEDFVKKAKTNGKEIAVWTVNESEEMQRMIKLGVDEIITNYPDRLIKTLSNLEN